MEGYQAPKLQTALKSNQATRATWSNRNQASQQKKIELHKSYLAQKKIRAATLTINEIL